MQLLNDFKKTNFFRKFAIILFTVLTPIQILALILKIEEVSLINIFTLAILILTIMLLNYFSIYDILHFEVPGVSTLILPLILIVFNIFIGLAYGFDFPLTYLAGHVTTPLLNLIGGACGAGVIAIVVLATKGNGMGGGDIRILGIVGLLVGFFRLINAFYFSIFVALVFGLIVAIKVRKFKGLRIPFVPFLVIGCYLAFFTSFDINEFLNTIVFQLIT
jgi:prepilin signal peptidase PulO-like enzyme (type II secretory pathway)